MWLLWGGWGACSRKKIHAECNLKKKMMQIFRKMKKFLQQYGIYKNI
jgi:hypothetical protein